VTWARDMMDKVMPELESQFRPSLAKREVALIAQRQQLKLYLRMKDDADDMHGVADAAMDIREIDAQLALLRLAISGI
jgi:hypothetical protein